MLEFGFANTAAGSRKNILTLAELWFGVKTLRKDYIARQIARAPIFVTGGESVDSMNQKLDEHARSERQFCTERAIYAFSLKIEDDRHWKPPNPFARELHLLAPNAIVDMVQNAKHSLLIKALREPHGNPSGGPI